MNQGKIALLAADSISCEDSSLSASWSRRLQWIPAHALVPDPEPPHFPSLLFQAPWLKEASPRHRVLLLLVGTETQSLGAEVEGKYHQVSECSSFPEALAAGFTALRTGDIDVACLLIQESESKILLVFQDFRRSWRAGTPVLAVLTSEITGKERFDLAYLVQGELEGLTGNTQQHLKSSPRVALEGPSIEQPTCFRLAEALLWLALSVHDRLLPPARTLAANHPLPDSPKFYFGDRVRPWFHRDPFKPRRAYFHYGLGALKVEEAPGWAAGEQSQGARCRRRAVHWPSEIFVFRAASRANLLEQLAELRLEVEASRGALSLAQLAWQTFRKLPPGSSEPFRLAIIASDLSGLDERLETARNRLQQATCNRLAMTSGIFFGCNPEVPGDLCFVFPGQGSQYPNMLLDTALAFPSVQAWFDKLDQVDKGGGPAASEFLFPIPGAPRSDDARKLLMEEEGAEAVTVAALALSELWQEFGLKPDVLAGYSIGELGALTAAGALVLEPDTVVKMMGSLTSERTPGGKTRYSSVAVTSPDRALLERLLATHRDELYLAIDSCPSQVVLTGTEGAVESAVLELQQHQVGVHRLPFDRGYHTPLYQAKAEKLRPVYHSLNFQPPQIPTFSAISLDWFPNSPEAVRDLAISQWTKPVRFREAIPRLQGFGVKVFLEMGPSSRLTGFIRDTLRGQPGVTALASDAQGRSGLRQIQQSFAQLFAAGYRMNPAPFFSSRELSSFNLPWPEDQPKRVETLDPEVSPREPDPPKNGKLQGQSRADDSPSLQLLRGHFELMDHFLAQQERLQQRLSGVSVAVSDRPNCPTAELEPPSTGVLGVASLLESVLPKKSVTEDGLRWELRLTVDNFPILAHHTLGNRASEYDPGLQPLPVLPFAFATEIMAQAARELLPEAQPFHLTEIRGARWLALDRGFLNLKIEARLTPSGSIAAELLECTETQEFSAYSCLVCPGMPPQPEPVSSSLEETYGGKFSAAAFYAYVFHGRAFQGIHKLLSVDDQGLQALIILPPQDTFMPSPTGPLDLVCEPILQDCAGQLVGFWLLEHLGMKDIGLYPFSITETVRWGSPIPTGVPIRAQARITFDGQTTKADFNFSDSKNRIVAKITNFRSRLFRVPPRSFSTLFFIDEQTYLSEALTWPGPEPIVVRELAELTPSFLEQSWGIWKRALAHVLLSSAERQRWNDLPSDRQTEALLHWVQRKELFRLHWQSEGFDWLPADLDAQTGGPNSPLPIPSVKIPSVATMLLEDSVIGACAPKGWQLSLHPGDHAPHQILHDALPQATEPDELEEQVFLEVVKNKGWSGTLRGRAVSLRIINTQNGPVSVCAVAPEQ